MSNVDEVVKRLLVKGMYAIDVEHIEQGKNSARKIFVTDVLHVLFSSKSRHYEGISLDKKLVVFSEGRDINDRPIRIISRLINAEGEIIVSIMQADIAEIIFAKTAYQLKEVVKNET